MGRSRIQLEAYENCELVSPGDVFSLKCSETDGEWAYFQLAYGKLVTKLSIQGKTYAAGDTMYLTCQERIEGVNGFGPFVDYLFRVDGSDVIVRINGPAAQSLKAVHRAVQSLMEKKEHLVKKFGPFVKEHLDSDEAVIFYFKAVNGYDMSLDDADSYAWLNTLFGYDIGAECAQKLIRRLADRDMSATELGQGSRRFIKELCGSNGYHLDFSEWTREEPKAYRYFT